jgi:hypothetical protein
MPTSLKPTGHNVETTGNQHAIDDADVQAVVLHWCVTYEKEEVKSSVPKFKPVTVTEAPPVTGMFLPITVIEAESKVKIIGPVPTTEAIVTSILLDVAAPDTHSSIVPELHATEVQRAIPITAVGEGSNVSKLEPRIVSVEPPLTAAFPTLCEPIGASNVSPCGIVPTRLDIVTDTALSGTP